MHSAGPVLLMAPLVLVLDFYTTRFFPWIVRRLIRRHEQKARSYGDNQG